MREERESQAALAPGPDEVSGRIPDASAGSAREAADRTGLVGGSIAQVATTAETSASSRHACSAPVSSHLPHAS